MKKRPSTDHTTAKAASKSQHDLSLVAENVLGHEGKCTCPSLGTAIPESTVLKKKMFATEGQCKAVHFSGQVLKEI